MKRVICCVIVFCSCSFVSAESVVVSGTIVNQKEQSPLSDIKVSVFKLTGTWKFWTLPKQELIGSATTNNSGEFSVGGDTSRYYVVEIDVNECWAPYKKVFDIKEDGNKVDGLEIMTWPEPCRH